MKHPGNVLTSVLLVVAMLGMATDAPRAQKGALAQSGQAPSQRMEEHRSAAAAQRARQARQSLRRAQAHARMPSTLYASTPSPVPVHADMSQPAQAGADPLAALASSSSAAGGTHRIPLFAPVSDPRGRQGFARIVNRSDTAGTVRIDAYDDAGTPYGPLTLSLGAGETVHFNSNDLERGNPAKGLAGATGPGEGFWRLHLTSSDLDLAVLAYMRTGDGFLTSLHDLAPRTEAGHRVPIFNPGGNTSQVSRLRLMNPGAAAVEVTIEGIDDEGASPGSAVQLSLSRPGWRARSRRRRWSRARA